MENVMTMTNEFAELSSFEMGAINGGSKGAAQAVLLIGGAVLLGVGAPIAGLAGAGAFATAYVSGIGLMGSAFFV